MSSKPSQTRTVDPFASYNSNVANRLTRMLSQNRNALLQKNSLRLEIDSTSPLTAVIVRTGTVFKDDVLIEVTDDHTVDFTDSDNYISFGAGFDEIGYYYVCLEYTYVKSRPAPDANIKILKPSQRSTYPTATSLLLLGIVKVINVGISQGIDLSSPLHNYDPENPDNRRLYIHFYAGTETGLPTHDPFRDTSRFAYDSETDKFWLGYSNRWGEIGVEGAIINVDTTGTVVGELCYANSSGAATPAIATSLNTDAEFSVRQVGHAIDNSGLGITSGIAADVPVETGITISTGDKLYLSATEAGTVTNVKTSLFYQVVGRALTDGNDTTPIDMIFTPKLMLTTPVEGTITPTTAGAGAFAGLYYSDIDISSLGATNAVNSTFFDDADDLQVGPAEVEMRDSGDTLRVYFGDNTLTINYIVTRQ